MSSHDCASILAKGVRIPQIGLGTWQLQGEALTRAVHAAAEAGYRHFDTAPRYENEAGLGAALRGAGLGRDSYFLTTKVWHTELAAPALLRSAQASVERLGVGPVDLLLIHWPNPAVPLAETIGALREAQRMGLAHNIGVSNFPLPLLEQAIALAEGGLLALQCEYHPRLDQSALIARCRREDMAFVAYAPIGSGQLLENPVVTAMARAHGRSPAQIMLRWHVQQGVVAIPRSRDPARIAENISVVDFALSAAEMAALGVLAAPRGRIFDPEWAPAWDDPSAAS